MNKKFYWGAMSLIGMLSLASCSNEDTIESPVITGEQVIVLDMQDTDVLSTRSRPLYSTANMGAEKVTDVKLLVFQISDTAKTLVREINIDNWNYESSDYQYGRQLTYRLTNKLDPGTYTIVAVGQDETTTTVAPYTWGTDSLKLAKVDIPDNSTWNSATDPGHGFKEFLPNPVDDPAEIFSGQSKPVTVSVANGNGAFTATVLLKRQVAGVLGYFDRIPAVIGEGADAKHVTNVRLVASKKNTRLDLTISLEDQNDDTTGNDPVECIVNGYEAADYDAKFNYLGGTDNTANVIYDIDLTKWFTGYSKGSGWAEDSYNADTKLLTKPENWVNAIDATNTEVKVADCAVLAGKFVIPFSKFTDGFDKETFELQLTNVNEGTTTILKAWRVKLDAGSQNAALGDGAYVYNIYRNHLYQIGSRGNGDDPNNPGVGGDDPQPLDKIDEQELIIKINDQWEFIHNMEIE